MKTKRFLCVFVATMLILEPMAVFARSGGGHSAPRGGSHSAPRMSHSAPRTSSFSQRGGKSSSYHAPQSSFSRGSQSYGRSFGSSTSSHRSGTSYAQGTSQRGSSSTGRGYSSGTRSSGTTPSGYSRVVGINDLSSTNKSRLGSYMANRATPAQRSSLQRYMGSNDHQHGNFSRNDHGYQFRDHQRFEGRERHCEPERRHHERPPCQPRQQSYCENSGYYSGGYSGGGGGFSMPDLSGLFSGGGGYCEPPCQPEPIIQYEYVPVPQEPIVYEYEIIREEQPPIVEEEIVQEGPACEEQPPCCQSGCGCICHRRQRVIVPPSYQPQYRGSYYAPPRQMYRSYYNPR